MSSKKNRKHHNNYNKNRIEKTKALPEKTVLNDPAEEEKKTEGIEVPEAVDGFVSTEDLDKAAESVENNDKSKESDKTDEAKESEKSKEDKKRSKKKSRKKKEVDSENESSDEESEEDIEDELQNIKGPFKKLKLKISRMYEAKNYKWILGCFIVAIIEDFILEILGRRSFTGAMSFIFHSPLVFFINILIIFGTLLLGLIFRKRLFFVFIFGFLWFVMGFINFMVLGYRITPFSAIDFLMAVDVMSMLDVYFNKFQQILLFAGIGAVIFLIIMFFIWTPKVVGKVNRLVNFLVTVGVFMLIYVLTTTATRLGSISDDFSNLGNAYKEYGFVYCFSNSIIDIGITKPDDYSEEAVDGLVERVDADYQVYLDERGRKKTPNIIIIQLESFMDIGRMEGIHTDIDSIPNFHKFKEDYPSGFLTVPSIGAGTANVECEVITGMRTSLFGAGEYPYKTVLTDTPCESLAQILKRQGYTTFAMHNNKAYFYSRNQVYDQLGFDYFVSQEYMPTLQYTSAGWAKDYNLVDEIKKCLDHTENDNDFVHCISVQGHGKYPEDAVNTVEHVHVTRDDGDTALTNQYGYYVNMCYEMDDMIGQLKSMLDARGENYVLIIYGDHLPSIPFDVKSIVKGNEFQTEYVIINNIGLDLPKQDIATYEVSDYLLTALNLDKGIYQRIHTTYCNRDMQAYTDALHLVQYDMLYGDKYIYSYIPEYYSAGMSMGLYPVSINEVSLSSNQILIHGENFTEFSTVLLNDEKLVTTFVNDRTIIVPKGQFEPLKKGDVIKIQQIDADKHMLSESVNEYIYDPGY